MENEYITFINTKPSAMKSVRYSFLVLLLILTELLAGAQNGAEVRDSIFSEILNENRTIEIRLPKGYEPESKERYDVIYITDGEWNMNNFSFIHSFALGDKFVPPVILVALPNTYMDGQNMRDRDFLPLEMKNNERAGGADKFLAFLKTEVIPYINDNYSTNGVNSLYGHSYGGVFSMYALLAEPDLFENYYCTDPPLGWEKGYLKKTARDLFAKTPELEKKLWIAGTSNNSSIMEMSKFLEKYAPEKLTWQTATYPNEKHNSVRLKGIYDGIKFCYK
jgi:predicted alpha/beta superfamily hydrolase